MHRTFGVAVVELDAVGGSAAEEGCVEQVGAPRAAGHRHAAGRPHGGEHRLGAGRDFAVGARDHHADGVEQMPAGVVARLLRDRGIGEPAHETRDGVGRPFGRMQRIGGLRHATCSFSGVRSR
jgi:hypothetical protein